MKENKSLKMADTMSAKAESNHERNGDHPVEEVASSPKAPPRRKRQGKALSGDDEEKENENESKSKENVPSVKPSPSKPPLPPRPADFSPRPAPTSAEKTLQTHPTKDPPSSQIPQPAKTPSQPPDHSRRPSNKSHSSPVPKRPPQPSRQTSVKTITPPQQEIKSPEAVRTITQHATQNKTSKTKSDRTTRSNEEQTVQRGVNRGKPQRPPEPNCEGIKTKPAQDTTPEAGIRDEKKLNRPPRPAVPPQPVRTVKDDEAIMPDKQKSSEMKGPPKPKRTLSKEGTVEVNVTTDSAQIPGAVVATEVNRPPKPPRVTASQEQEKIQSPKLNRPPEPSRPTNDLNSSPIHVEGKKDEIVKTQEHEQKEDKPNRPSLPRQRSAADGRKVAKHKENFESLDISKSSKVDRPPPPSRQTVLNEGEKDEIVLDSKCLNKTGEEKETHSERENVEKLKGTGAGKERRSVSFIVQSFTKTEIGSLRKNVSRKPQQDDRTHVRVNIKESKKPQKPPPPLLPKPTRERLPSPGSKGSGTKEKMEKKSEEQEVKDQGGRKKSSQDRAVENGSAIVETGNDDRGEDNVKDKHTDGSLQKEGKLTAAVNERVNMVESGVSGNQQGLTGDTDDIKEEHTTTALGQNEQLGDSKDKERTPRMSRLGNEAGGTSLDTHVSKGKKRTKLGLLSDSGEQKEEMSVLQKTDERDRTKSVSESVKYTSDLENQQDDKNKKEKDKTREKSKDIEKSFEIGDSQEPNAQNFREVEDFEEKNSLSAEKYLSDKKVVVETGIQEKNKHEKSSFDVLKYLGDEPNVSDKANEEQAQEGEKPEDLVKGKCIVEERLLCEKRHQVDELKSGKRQNVQDEKEEEKTRDLSKKLNEENNVECQENGRKVIEEESKINEKEAHSVEQETKDKDVIWKVSGVVVSESGTKVIDQSEESYPNETNVDSEKICVLNETETFASEDKLEENKVDRQRSEQEMNSEHSTLEEKNLTVPMERNKTLVNENEPAVAGRAADLRDTEGFVGESDEVGTPEDGATAEDNTGTAGVEKPSITEDSKVRLVSMEEDEGKKSKNAACEVATNNDSIKLSTQKLPAPLSNIKSEKIEETPIKPSVQSPKKKPPPKPKRTSSLKRNSRPLSGESDDLQNRFPPVVEAKMTEESTSKITNTGHVLSKRSTPSNHKKPSMSSPKNVTFQESVVQSQETSTAIVRSKSFTSSNKRRSVSVTSNENKTGKKSEARWERLTRSMSFGAGTKKKSQPPRPPPPTFFVQTTPTPDVTEEKNEKFTFDQELEKLDVPLENKAKHDSLISENTTDSETDSEKEDLPQKSKTYYISREILSTERTFVDTLKLVSKDFKEALESGNKKLGRQVIPEETLNDIMLNISQIYDFDKDFFKALEDRMKTWDDQQRIGDIIKKYSPFLKMYKTYIQGYDNAMAVLSDALKKYPLFAEIVREFESSERCQNLTIGMYMLKPIQRIPSYRLLLIDYLKHLSKDSLDHKDVSDALTIVSEVATHINEDMKRVDKFEEVLKVQRSLVGQVEIVKPGRDLIKEGMLMKLCRKDMQPRMFYLFTDVLLYTTPVANNQFRLNLSLPLGEITVEIPASPDFDNEFSIISTKKSFTLSSSTAEERDEWLEALVNASNEINKKKITFHLAKKEKMDALVDSLQESDDKDFKLGSKAPVWIPDARVTMCMLCTDDFTTVTNRRHHCRACGKVICGSCSSNSAPLPYLNFEAARVCDNCYDVLSKDLTDTTPASVAATTVPENVETTKTDSLSRSTPVPKPSAAELANRFKKNKKPTPRKSRKSIPSVLREVQASEESTISGYLNTRKGKKWQKRWYVVKDNVLYAYKASSDVVALDTCPLLGFDVRGPEKVDGDSKKIVFQLIHAGTPPLILQTDNLSSAERWVTTLRRSTMLPH